MRLATESHDAVCCVYGSLESRLSGVLCRAEILIVWSDSFVLLLGFCCKWAGSLCYWCDMLAFAVEGENQLEYTTRADVNCEQSTWWRCESKNLEELKKSGGIEKIRRNFLKKILMVLGLRRLLQSMGFRDVLHYWMNFCSLKNACYVTRAAAKNNHDRLVLLPLWNMYKIFYK